MGGCRLAPWRLRGGRGETDANTRPRPHARRPAARGLAMDARRWHTALLLASDALDVDHPLLPIALDHLALAALVRATHNGDLVVLAHRH